MSYSSNNLHQQQTANAYIGSREMKDDDPLYINKQKNILTQQKQEELGKIPQGIKRFSHRDPIQSALYGFNSQEIDLAQNDTSIDKYHQYNANYDYLNKNGLLRENFKYRFNTIQLNIDSSKRLLTPLIEYDEEVNLENNPLSFETHNLLNLLTIKYPNHNFSVGDIFSLSGIKNDPIRINTIYSNINNNQINAVTFSPNSRAVSFSCIFNIETSDNTNIALFDPHFKLGTGIDPQILEDYDTTNLKVSIDGFNSLFVGNIPTNFLNRTHRVYFVNPDPNSIINSPVNVQGIITGFYILLDVPYVGVQPTTNYVISLKFNYYGGIPLNQLEAEFPINSEHIAGYHKIYSVTSGSISVKLNNTSYYYDNVNGNNIQASFGGDSVVLSKINNIVYSYDSPNSYIMGLPRSISNVISVKLISSIFPNISKNITNNSNALYWQNQDDGDIIYKITLDEGNYTPQLLESAIEQKVALVESNRTFYLKHNIIKVSINPNTNRVEFTSYKEALLKEPIIAINTFGNQPTTLTIEHPLHGLKVGDNIKFSGFISHMGIPESSLNTTHVIHTVQSTNTYQIIIDNYNQTTSIDTKGGNNANITVPNIFRLMFNMNDTFGEMLGFRNVTNANSITQFKSTITNADAYENEVVTLDNSTGIKYIYTESGNKVRLANNKLKLHANDYILMSIEEFNSTFNLGTTSAISKYFAKINMKDANVSTLYDTFVPTLTTTYSPFELNKLTIKFYTQNGELCEFDGLDHSFVIEIMSADHEILESGIVSNKTIF